MGFQDTIIKTKKTIFKKKDESTERKLREQEKERRGDKIKNQTPPTSPSSTMSMPWNLNNDEKSSIQKIQNTEEASQVQCCCSLFLSLSEKKEETFPLLMSS